MTIRFASIYALIIGNKAYINLSSSKICFKEKIN